MKSESNGGSEHIPFETSILHNQAYRVTSLGAQLVVDTSVSRKSVVAGSLITELVLVNLATVKRGEYFTPSHLHPFHQIDVVLGGWVEHKIEGWSEPARLTAGMGVVIPPLVRHGMAATEGFRHASFKLFLVSRMARGLGDAPFQFTASARLRGIIEAASQRCRDGKPFADDMVSSAGALCLIEASDQAPIRTAQVCGNGHDFRRTILPILERVAEAPFGGWTVADLARAAKMSVDHFSKCFHHVLGQTPQTFILETRLRNAASDLLAEPPMTIEVVADRAGYSSRHTFTRAFSSLFGVSPDAFRRGAAGTQASYRLIHH